MIYLICLILPGALLSIPALLALGWWFSKGRAYHTFPWAAVGAGLMALSFFTLPWLTFSPLERVGLDWLYDVAPYLGRLLALLGIDNLDRLLPIWRVIGIHPPGWLALALNAQTWPGLLWLGVVTALLGGLIFALALWVELARRPKWSAAALIALATLSLLTLLYFLPDIDGLGEHDFSNIVALVIPIFLNVHMSWFGPFVMVSALLLLLVGGINRFNERDE